MKKVLYFMICYMQISTLHAFAQINLLPFDKANCNNFSHPVSSVTVFDKRPRKEEIMGWMRAGNTVAPVVGRLTLKKSVEQYFLDLSNGLPADPNLKLTIVMHRFYLSERGQSDYTSFEYAADYFIASGDNEYSLLGSVDTIIKSNTPYLSLSLFNSVDNCLCFLYEDLFKTPKDTTVYTADQALNYLNEKKKKNPVYNTDSIPDGVYAAWDDFLQLHSNKHETLTRKDDKVKVMHAGQKRPPFESTIAQVYVLEGTPYYNLEGALYRMEKIENDFFIVVKMREISTKIMYLFGLPGVLAGTVMEGTKGRTGMEFLLDYKTGRLLKIKNTDESKYGRLRL
jgi:hypothetical protein